MSLSVASVASRSSAWQLSCHADARSDFGGHADARSGFGVPPRSLRNHDETTEKDKKSPKPMTKPMATHA